MQLPSFSIITVSFNSGRTIGQTIESVLSQTLSNVEYLIIDGESTDDTLQIVNDFGKKISHIVSEPDKGIYHAMNKGIMLASGEIIGILNSDDLYAYPGYLEDVARLFAETRADIVYSDLVYVDRNNERIIREWKSGYYTPGDFKKGWMPPHPTVFVHRKVYDQAGLFNLDLKSSSDYEILLRFFEKHRFKAAYLPKTGVRMRVGGRSNATPKTRLKANREDYLAWKINGLKPWPLTRILKPLRKIPQFFISGKNSG